jgi:hypothetical protein
VVFSSSRPVLFSRFLSSRFPIHSSRHLLVVVPQVVLVLVLLLIVCLLFAFPVFGHLSHSLPPRSDLPARVAALSCDSSAVGPSLPCPLPVPVSKRNFLTSRPSHRCVEPFCSVAPLLSRLSLSASCICYRLATCQSLSRIRWALNLWPPLSTRSRDFRPPIFISCRSADFAPLRLYFYLLRICFALSPRRVSPLLDDKSTTCLKTDHPLQRAPSCPRLLKRLPARLATRTVTAAATQPICPLHRWPRSSSPRIRTLFPRRSRPRWARTGRRCPLIVQAGLFVEQRPNPTSVRCMLEAWTRGSPKRCCDKSSRPLATSKMSKSFPTRM